MFAHVIRPNYFRPMVARPIIARMPISAPIAPLSFRMPVCCPTPVMPFSMMNPFMAAIAPMPMVSPVLASTNIFLQNISNMLTSYARRIRQQNQFFSTFKPSVSNYRFGSLTANRFGSTGFFNNSLNTSTQNLSFWKRLGYCATSGLSLAKTAVQKAVGFTGFCAKYVKNAIAAAGLGSYVKGHAYQMISILRANKNFKEIPVGSVDPKKLPAGCILVYGKGQAGYSKRYGHTEITTGTGRAVSDGITNNIKPNIAAIFIPVA